MQASVINAANSGVYRSIKLDTVGFENTCEK